MTAEFVAFLLMTLTVVYVCWPLVASRSIPATGFDEENDRVHSRIVQLETEKNLIYAQIKDLEFENATGKIDDEEFAAARDQYKRQAVPLVQEIEYLNNLHEHLEQEIEGTLERESRSQTATATAEAEPVGAEKCNECGGEIPAGNKFCGQCGKPVA